MVLSSKENRDTLKIRIFKIQNERKGKTEHLQCVEDI